MEKDKPSNKKSSQNETISKKTKKDPSLSISIASKAPKTKKEEKSSKESKEGHQQPQELQELQQLQELQELQEKLKKQEEDFLYLRAEFENYRRRMAKEKENLRQWAVESIVLRLLEVMDNFERALSVELHVKNLKTYTQGIQMTAQELKGVLQQFGLESVETPIGTPFDPTLHEALGNEENKKFPPGHISQIYKKAYKLKGKLLRPAQVMVVAPRKKEKT